MKLFSSILILFSFFSAKSYADSYMHLTNNTMETLTVSTSQTGHSNITEGNEWNQLTTKVKPLETIKFLRVNRDKGIKWGKEYIFNTSIKGTSDTINLRQKLKGTITFSSMWLSAQDDPWHYDRDIHKIALSDSRDLAYKSHAARASGDDIHYVIHDQFKTHKKSLHSNELNILTYNAWALLPGITAKNTGNRLDTIIKYMKNYDVIVFQEIFDPILTAKFRRELSNEYPYLTEIPWKLGKLLTGGSFIASRWPIEAQDAIVYDTCKSDGCLAGKGINYAKIRKGSNAYHVFGTHTHAYATEADVSVRFSQLGQLKSVIDHKNIPYNEPVIMAGDFNVDKLNYPQEYEAFLFTLDAIEPEQKGRYKYSYAGSANTYAEAEYNEYLDYILYSNAHIAPYASNNMLLTPRSISSEHWGSWDLSDHFPVSANMHFPLKSEFMPF